MTVRRSETIELTSVQDGPPTPVYPASRNGSQQSSAISPDKIDPSTSKPSASTPGHAPMAALQKGNTRRLGQRLTIQLAKSPPPDGFGFTLTSRDMDYVSLSSDVASGEALVYIKNICPRGAAIDDGRLKAGDRILEVNGHKVTKEFAQPEIVKLLRQMKPGETVTLLVSRQTDEPSSDLKETEKGMSPALPRPLVDDSMNDEAIPEICGKRTYDQMLLTFDIPLNDTGKFVSIFDQLNARWGYEQLG